MRSVNTHIDGGYLTDLGFQDLGLGRFRRQLQTSPHGVGCFLQLVDFGHEWGVELGNIVDGETIGPVGFPDAIRTCGELYSLLRLVRVRVPFPSLI